MTSATAKYTKLVTEIILSPKYNTTFQETNQPPGGKLSTLVFRPARAAINFELILFESTSISSVDLPFMF